MADAGFTTHHAGIDLHLDQFVAAKGGDVPHVGMIVERRGGGIGFLGAMKQSFVFAQHRTGKEGRLIEIPREKTAAYLIPGLDPTHETLRLVMTRPKDHAWLPSWFLPRDNYVFTGAFNDVLRFHSRAMKAGPGAQP